ncbi:MAG TPA: VOC family protein [Rhizomicrobium sp.]
MTIAPDHLILAVNDRRRSLIFYEEIVGFRHEGEDGPFSMLRVSPDFMIQLAAWGTSGGEHLAFAMTKPEFDAIFARLKMAGIDYGDRFDSVGNMKGPGDETGARGMGKTIYFFDPDRHLLEIRHYERE